MLIAPLTKGEASVVAAGSVVTDEIDNSVAIARTKQKILLMVQKNIAKAVKNHKKPLKILLANPRGLCWSRKGNSNC